MNHYLSKSDFKVARDCATKLFYKKNRYPTKLDENSYMELLADGGFMVGKFAQLLFAEGIMIADLDPAKAVAETTTLMAKDAVTLFEPAFWSEGYLARVDILKKAGDRLQLIEVKSKGYDATTGLAGRNGAVRAEWVEYIEDVAFQRMVIARALPHAKIECFLLLPDKAAVSEIDLLPTLFSLTRQGRAVEVDFLGDVPALRQSKLLRLVPVDAEVESVYDDVCAVASKLLPLIKDGPQRAVTSLGYHCRECEYRMEESVRPNGFQECWGDLGRVTPALLDLYQLGRIKNAAKAPLADMLIQQKKASLFDMPVSALTTSYAERQRIQIEHTKAQTEWRSAQLRPTLEALAYPLHFIDFETSRLVLPYHRGMRPFEQVAFQWSCHTIDHPGAALRHAEWINVAEGFPNVRFAQSLRDVVGEHGTLLTWSHHEKTTLEDIARQIADYGLGEDDLKGWLLRTVGSGRLFDLCAHALSHFFHPAMRGSTSIKAVLPAVWQSNAALRADPLFQAYVRIEDGVPVDPYQTLSKLEIFDQAEVVNEGTGAMRAYQEMLYGAGRRAEDAKEAWRKLLLQYCGLDTMAMVMIWKHWTS
ncbi:DUF2779 domain-containing protein [Nibricoccus sp. IMCC34717]|uniref:DUF2779 domain-containing protein n=1 Tax=Nibricoccus sp. IMCC34717 TaxID=3034021 RepID=UPI00384C54C4